MLRISTIARRVFQAKTVTRNFGAGPAHGHAHADKHGDAHSHGAHDAHGHDDHHDDHHHEGPHVSEAHERAGKFCLLTAYLWIFYRLKEDNGQLFGYYQPWLHPHEHEHYHFKSTHDNLKEFVTREEFESGNFEEHDEHDDHHGDDEHEDEEDDEDEDEE